jgi:predicted dehydrogenase
MSTDTLGTAVVGCGLIGKRRAQQVHLHPKTHLALAVDPQLESAKATGEAYGAAASVRWQEALSDDVDIVVVSTPNAFLTEVACAALEAGKHVLIEKPMGRNIGEATSMKRAAELAERRLKVGFNHRYHPALMEAYQRYAAGEIGAFIHARARYGHGGRPGYEKEWRGDRELAGGGELTDQGVHVIDLLQWFKGGPPEQAFGYVQTGVWPLGDLEDNAFALLRWHDGGLASLHTSWTQWKNLFSFEVFGTMGSLVVDGLGGSYGTETLTVAIRKPEGGVPNMESKIYAEADESWALEWADFVQGIETGSRFLGEASEGVDVMRTLDAIYRAASSGMPAVVTA